MPTRSTAAARPRIPTIACINQAKTPLGVDFDKLIRALQKYVDHHLAPVWGTPAKLVKATKPPRGAWVLMFIDSAEDVDKKHLKDFAYHLFKGQPMARVFVKSTIGNDEPISLVASHELAEMLVNPDCNLWALGRGNRLYSYEICDAVEEEEFKIDRLAMSDFVYPAYYEAHHKPGSVQFDHLKQITRPFQLLAGGYALVRKGQKTKPISGSKAKQKRFLQEDRRLHRTESMR
jgi:hypothetical protein